MNILLLREALLLAHEYGIDSVRQLGVFIAISQADGITVTELSGANIKQDDQVAWEHQSSMVAKLLAKRIDGEGLVYRAEHIVGYVGKPPQKLRLTAKGFRLLEELRDLGFH